MGRLLRCAVPALALVLSGCSTVTPSAPVSVTPPEFASIDTGSGSLLVTAGIGSADRKAWTTRSQWAATVLAATDLGELDAGWDGTLTVELVTDMRRYRELAGADAATAAAVTRCEDGLSTVTVNPRILSAKPEYLDSLLLHEAVHVATGSPCAQGGPTWVKEGLAEWVAAEHSASTRSAIHAWVVERLQAGLPTSLPTDADFTGDDQQQSYALASVAVAATVERGGARWAMSYFQRALEGGAGASDTAKVTRWYLDDLEAVSA